MLRRIAAIATFILIFAGGLHTFYWRMLKPGVAEALGARLRTLPFTKTPGLHEFMLGVRERTRDGERIAIIVPARRYEQGYIYAFTRSTYVLAGRTTLPIPSRHDASVTQTIASADAVAVWSGQVALPGFRVVWSGHEGTLHRRIR